ncbi:MAG: hypothetical protein GC161_15050 [Planctomycetaceae bacterium]|nr:hypothetical protein [Planctomycetaceae bacterium]
MDARFHGLALIAVLAAGVALAGYAAGRGMGVPWFWMAAFTHGTSAVVVARVMPIIFFGV